MSITQTTLTADLSATGLTAAVTSGSGFPGVGTIVSPGYLVRIDTEYMLAIAQPVANTIKLAMRGYNGTVAVAHDLLSKVEVSASPADFSPVPAGWVSDLFPGTPFQQTIGEDRTFTTAEVASWGNYPQRFAITKGSAAAITLVAPSKAQDGLVVTFTSLTAFLHVITATTLLADGATKSPYTTATGANTTIGATLTLQAQNGLWNVVANSSYTLATV